MSVTVVISLLIAAAATLFVQRARAAELQQIATAAAADAVAAADADEFLQELTIVRTVGFQSVDAARSSRQIVVTHVRQEKQAERERIRRAEARAAAAAQQTATDPVANGGSADSAPRESGGLVIGDSVSLGAESCLAPLGYNVDSEVGRQFSVGLDHLRVHAADGLPDSVVIHLGTNGPFTLDGFRQVMELTGSQRRVVWVTIALPPRSQYSFVDSLNEMIRSQASEYGNVRIADFAAASDEHPEWMASDGIHIGGSGCTGFAQVVDDAVTRP